ERFQVYHRWKCGPTLATMASKIKCMHCAKIRQKRSRLCLVLFAATLTRFFVRRLRTGHSIAYRCRITQMLQFKCSIYSGGDGFQFPASGSSAGFLGFGLTGAGFFLGSFLLLRTPNGSEFDPGFRGSAVAGASSPFSVSSLSPLSPGFAGFFAVLLVAVA